MRRAFTLQLYDADNVCLSPGDCGTTCHCGLAVDAHHFGFAGHHPRPMFCMVCRPMRTARPQWPLPRHKPTK